VFHALIWHGENDFFASTKRYNDIASADSIVVVAIPLGTATTVTVEVTIHTVVTINIVNTATLVC